MINISASGSQMDFAPLGRGIPAAKCSQSNSQKERPPRPNTPGGTAGSESPQGLTIRDEVLGYVKRHLDGQRAGELGAAHHGQDAGADRDQGQRGLVHGALHRTWKAERGVGGQKAELYQGLARPPALPAQMQESPSPGEGQTLKTKTSAQ